MKGKYYLHCRAADVFVMSEDELGENTPPEGDWNGDRNGPDCVNAAQNYIRGFFFRQNYLCHNNYFFYLIYVMTFRKKIILECYNFFNNFTRFFI